MPNDPQMFRRIVSQVAEEYGGDIRISEAELVNRWFTAGVFSELGYGTHRDDYRVELRVPGAGRADVVLRAFGQCACALVEFKRPGVALEDHVRQLKDYANQLLPDVAILTNGRDLWLYSRSGPLPLDPLTAEPSRYDLTTLSEGQAQHLFNRLSKVEVDLADLSAVEDAVHELIGRPVHVEGPQSSGGGAFLERFSLDSRSVFGRLVSALFDVLPVLERRSQFTSGAYSFWRRAYARQQTFEDSPKSWRPLLGERRERADLQRFMFCLESAYAFLARVLLAKAMQDAGFPNVNVATAFLNSAQIRQTHGRLEPGDLPAIAADLFQYAGRQAFPTVFASDIFDWWQDVSQLQDPAPVASSLAETVLAVFGFDFSSLEGDVLGELYQHYFDPETRLALGEFYTPPEVVEFILDAVGYLGEATDRGRLLDPSCGSGTFLVAALRRYLSAHTHESPGAVLRRLVGGLHIVGLDVNPFATLLAQVNYAAGLLPTYSQALREGPLVIRNLPVYRTDSLRFERREAEEGEETPTPAHRRRRGSATVPGTIGFRFTYSGDMAHIRERLPVRTRQRGFVEVLVSVPRADVARERRLVDNLEEYALALSALFDSVDEGEDGVGLARRLQQQGLPKSSELAEFMAPALSSITDTVEKLRTEYNDGRFRKTLRDLAVAVVVKNELPYEFVVGNPPYVRVQRLPGELKEYWIGRYAWVQGNFDLYLPFIERAVTDWLKEGGRLGFICSDRFLLAKYAQELRAQLPSVAAPELVLDLRDTRVFRGALNYPCVFVFRRGVASGGAVLAGRAFTDPPEGPAVLLADARATLRSAKASNAYRQGEYTDAFPVSTKDLEPRGWCLMPQAERRVFRALEQASTDRLRELTDTQSGGFAGYQTSADDLMVLRLVESHGDRLVLKAKGGGDRVEIECEAVRPWLFGHDVERWYVDWDNWYVIFPYVKVDGEYRLAPSREYAHRFPYAGRVPFVEDAWPRFWEYVTKGRSPSGARSVRSALEAREDGRFKRNQPSAHLWYGPSYPRSIDLYELPKLVLQISSTEADVAVDVAGRYVFQAGGRGGGVYGLLMKNRSPAHLSFITALLNSRPLDFYLKHVSTVYSGKAYSYSDAFLKDIPIVLPRTPRNKQVAKRVTELADTLSHLKTALRITERACAAFPEPQSANLPSGVDRYPLERLADGHPSAKTIQRGDVTFDTQLDGRPALRVGRAAISLPSAAHADVVRAWLESQPRQALAAAELLGLRLPETPAACQALLEGLERQKQEIVHARRQIEEGEREIDSLVLQLYGLADDKDAGAVIEDFLGRF